MYYPLVMFPARYVLYEDALADKQVKVTPSDIDALTFEGLGYNPLYDLVECLQLVFSVLNTSIDDTPHYGIVHDGTFIPLEALTHRRGFYNDDLTDMDAIVRMVKKYPNRNYPIDKESL